MSNVPEHPDIWLKEIERLKRRTANVESHQNLVAFYGSSSIRLWVHLKQDLQPFNVINLGFGGSTFYWCAHYFETLFESIEPTEIILYGGDNDLSNGSATQAIADLKRLIGKIQYRYQKIKITIISVKPSPERAYLQQDILAFNQQLEAIAAALQDGRFLNIHDGMLNADGKAKEELFLSDQLHMNRNGYAIWKTAVRDHLESTITM